MVFCLALAVAGGCGGDGTTGQPAGRQVQAAPAAESFEVGFADSAFGSTEGDLWAKRAVDAGADSIRVNLYWNIVAPLKPADPRDPADPAYDWTEIDTQVRSAGDNGLSVLLTVLSAPAFAEGSDRPDQSVAPAGTWRPDPAAYGDFAHAVATRYSGEYPDPLRAAEALPAVTYFSAWNEPNISTYLTPQYVGTENASAAIYAELLDSFYAEVKAVNPDAQVATGGTAPFGSEVGGPRTSPLDFWREVFCLNEDLSRGDCPRGTGPRFDLLAHHPIIFPPGPPERSYPDPDDIGVADFDKLVELLRAAEDLGTVSPVGHGLIVPELWWETNPPQIGAVPARRHAGFIARSLHELWKQGVRGVWFLQIRDTPIATDEAIGDGDGTLQTYQTGVLTPEGEPKLAFYATRFPVVAEPAGEGRMTIWGRAPSGDVVVTIEAQLGDRTFAELASIDPRGSRIFEIELDVADECLFRATQGEIESLVSAPFPSGSC